MKTSTFIKEEQLITEAIDTLIDKLGPVETNRFLSLLKARRVESVRRHQLWQSQLKKGKFFDKVFKE
jgi:hypothetical protein